jgi:aspartate aminotransferase
MEKANFKVGYMAENLQPPQIIKLANEINRRISNGEFIYNLTIGDFNPKIFPIPELMKEEIIKAYNERQTNYPPADGLQGLREGVQMYLKERGGFDYALDEIVVASGGRPIIFSCYQTVVEKGDGVIYPVPSWNNPEYCHIVQAKSYMIATKPENNFMPDANDMKPYIKDAKLIVLCSPMNPAGTTFSLKQLTDICELILEENYRRSDNERPVYLLVDQMYWGLREKGIEQHNPVAINSSMRNYTIFVDGASKAFAATGLRVGWTYGPKKVVKFMQNVILHMGAWAPRAEQTAIGVFLKNKKAVDEYLEDFKSKIFERMHIIFDTFKEMKDKDGLNVDAISPLGALYCTVKIDLKGKKTPDGKILDNPEEYNLYVLGEAKIAMVPFGAFGADENMPWYRISVGTCTIEELKTAMKLLREALLKLK